ncbi:MAG TPA: RsmE family RNA methyltransferase [bacterium]|nr:RsmE family RNA methyltransferase [bacterium]
MHRFSLSETISGDRVVLRDAQARHASVVLRVRPGERIVVFDGSGREFDVELESVDARAVTGRIVATRKAGRFPLHITLLQGVPKGAKMDDVIRMGTEIGVAEFVPFLSERTVAEGRQRADRWRRVATEAAKQSGRSDVPVVHDPSPLTQALEGLAGHDLLLVPWEAERHRSIRDVLEQSDRVSRIAIAIGPEGGLEAREIEEAARFGGVAVTLGPSVLRTETAGIVAVSMVLYGLVMRTTGRGESAPA